MEADGVSDYLNFGIPAEMQDLSGFLAYAFPPPLQLYESMCDSSGVLTSALVWTVCRLLESKKKELGITDVLVSLTTLEEVFLRITEEAENKGEQDDDGSDDDIDGGSDDDLPIAQSVEVHISRPPFL
jgi:hypothetical protein